MSQVPPEIPLSVIAKARKCTQKAAKGTMRRAGILGRDGRRYVVSRSRLREKFLDTYEEVFAMYELDTIQVPRRAPT